MNEIETFEFDRQGYIVIQGLLQAEAVEAFVGITAFHIGNPPLGRELDVVSQNFFEPIRSQAGHGTDTKSCYRQSTAGDRTLRIRFTGSSFPAVPLLVLAAVLMLEMLGELVPAALEKRDEVLDLLPCQRVGQPLGHRGDG